MTIFDTFKECFMEELTKLENGKKTEQWALEAINELGEIMTRMERKIDNLKKRNKENRTVGMNSIGIVFDKKSNDFGNLSLYLMQNEEGEIGICCVEAENKLIPCFSFGENEEHMEHWNDIPKQIERDGKGECFLVKFKKDTVRRDHVVLDS